VRWNFCLSSLIILALAGCARTESEAAKARAAQAALAQGDLETARRWAAGLSRESPYWAEGQMVLGALAWKSKDSRTALEHYRTIPWDGSQVSLAAAHEAAQIELSLGRINNAIQCYTFVLKHRPGDLQARETIADLYALTGQRRLADRHLSELMKSTQLSRKQLVLLTDFDRRDPRNRALLVQLEASAPRDPAVQLGLAIEDLVTGNLASARRRLEAAVSADPSLAVAQGQLGELLLDESESEFARWCERLPDSLRNEAEIWNVRGLWAQRRQQPEFAARCFWEAARQTPTSHRALQQFGLAMSQVDRAAGEAVLQRAQLTFDMRHHLSKALNSQGRDEDALRQVVALLLQCGREWEAWTWANFALDIHPQSTWPHRILEQLSEYPQVAAPRIRESENLLLRYDLSVYEAADDREDKSSATSVASSRRARIHFADQAGDLGIDFIYRQGQPDRPKGVRMQESTGGGIGVVDFDGDGRPDLFFTQGLPWPYDSDAPLPSPQDHDRLYRNRGEGFQDVTDLAGILPEVGFGQGCSVGDFNNDGFQDLYVANIGANRLLINCGDGTFRDATTELQRADRAWTTSCLIADIDADGNPDLFDVNYLEGELLYRKICDEKTCTPQEHQSTPDRLYLSNGDGTVRAFDFGGEKRWGAGLGIVAFVDEGSVPRADRPPDEAPAHRQAILPAEPAPRRLSLFIANDHEPNFFLANVPAGDAETFGLSDYSFLRGLAVNKDGLPMACMGVASGDLNDDGLLDLFVTNYKGEANNLYLQTPGGFFADAIAGSGLKSAGIPYVGWGTQGLDADNDGQIDLIVANGHVGDFRTEGLECYMPPQFFHNRGAGQFEELTADVVGAYFARKLLGRSVAKLDWNGDGRIDCVISNIADRAVLLTNQSIEAGRYLNVRLHATTTARDAAGAIVEVVAAGRRWRQQLVAGDGYQASNERQLHFGLGAAESVTELRVHWPSGATTILRDLPVDATIDIIESAPGGILHGAPRRDAQDHPR